MFLLFAGAGLLIVLLAIPLILRKVKMNSLYGFRVSEAMEDPQVWYEANAYAGWRLLGTGIIVMVCSAVLYALSQVTLLTYSLSILGVVSVTLLVTLVQSLLYLRNL